MKKNFIIASTKNSGNDYQMEVDLKGSEMDQFVLFHKCRKKALEIGLLKEGLEAFTTIQHNPFCDIDCCEDMERDIFLPIINSYFEEKYGKIGKKLNLRHSVKRGLLSKEQAKNLIYHENFIGIIPLKFLMIVPEGSEIAPLVSKYDPSHIGSKSFVFNIKKFFGKTEKKLYTLYGNWEEGLIFLDHKGLSQNTMFIVKDDVSDQATVITKKICRTISAEKVPYIIKEISKEISFEKHIRETPLGSGKKNADYEDVLRVALAHGWTFPRISDLHPNAFKLYYTYDSGGNYGGRKLIISGHRMTGADKFLFPVNSIQDIKNMGGYKFALGCYIAFYKNMRSVSEGENTPENLRWVKKITDLELFKDHEDVGVLVKPIKKELSYNYNIVYKFIHDGIIFNAIYRIEAETNFDNPEDAIFQKAGFEKAGLKNIQIFRMWENIPGRIGEYGWRYVLLRIERFKEPIDVSWLPKSKNPNSYYSEIKNEIIYHEGVSFPDKGWILAPKMWHSGNGCCWGYLNNKVSKWRINNYLRFSTKMVFLNKGKIIAGAKDIF